MVKYPIPGFGTRGTPFTIVFCISTATNLSFHPSGLDLSKQVWVVDFSAFAMFVCLFLL